MLTFFKVELKSTRDRLRRKLEQKKKKLEEQKTKTANKIIEKHEEIDLDALADEIEGL